MAFRSAVFLTLFTLNLQNFQLATSEFPSTIGDGQCIWYDTCLRNPEKPSQLLNCKYDGPPKPLRGTSKKLFKSTCPELAEEILNTEEYGGDMYTCCSGNQIAITSAQIIPMTSLLNNCPACLSNLRKNFCYFACHPRHSAFLNPTTYLENDADSSHGGTYNTSIFTVAQYQSESYIDVAYESCKNVYFAPLNGPAMDVLCGPWGSEQCTPRRLFDYFGANYLAPFNITYFYGDENTTAPTYQPNGKEGDPHPVTPFTVETFPCNTTNLDMACRCEDCIESCPTPPKLPPPPEPNMIGQIPLYVFIIIIVYLIFVLLVIGSCCAGKGLPGWEPDTKHCGTCHQKLSAKFEESFEYAFRKFTIVIAHYPYIVLLLGAIIIAALSSGIVHLKLTTNPVDLWAAPTSRVRQDKDRFDAHFGPFYRTNQIIITPVDIDPFEVSVESGGGDNAINFTYEMGPVFNDSFMWDVLEMQLQIMNLTAEYDNETVTMNDVCIKPMSPMNNICLIQSVLNYWQNDPNELHRMMYDEETGEKSTEYIEHLFKCVSNPSYVEQSETCMGSYGGPVFPYVALGGYLSENETLAGNPAYEKSTALVITFLLQNYLDTSKLGPAMAWEKAYLDFLKNYKHKSMKIAFYSERSLEDEIKRESKGEVAVILISYFVMFAYVAITLGNFSNNCNRICIETKITLGLSSVILVFLSVAAAIGLCAYIGIESTLFVIEVIPFLVLAVGVDNIFLLVQTWQRIERHYGESVEDHVARCVGRIAPSMILATSSEAICFFLGSLSDMPAVHAFSLYAGFALTIDFILQMTCLVALIVVDAKRENANRFDVLCCLTGPEAEKKNNDSSCVSFFETIYAPILLSDFSRFIVLLVFVGGFCASCAIAPKLDVGLEQDIGMPDDSYVLDYFTAMADYLSVGSPVYFVVEGGYDWANTSEQNLVCQSRGCNEDSLLAQIFMASKFPDKTCIGTGANSWVDGYFQWISDTSDETTACCRLDENDQFINSSAEVEMSASKTCLTRRQLDSEYYHQRPRSEFFLDYLPEYLIDNPHGTKCPQAGHAAYSTSVNISDTEPLTEVGPTNFMAYHTILKVSREFTDAVDKAYQLTDEMNAYLKNQSANPVNVFPYSIFYVFYEQYLTMWSATALSLGVSFASLFLVMFLLTGFDFRTTIINMIIIIMVTVDIMGTMVPWGIQLNAISLVNLVMAAGIATEFCSHITHAFAMIPTGTKIERATRALAYTGTSVLSGITLTKFGGIIVLAFSNSQVFIVFYFRMYLLIVLYGAVHGLVLLPVLLSLIGPSPNPYVSPRKGGQEKSREIPLSFVNHGADLSRNS